MLCCPARLPFKASRRLPGGSRKSRSSRERSSCVSFRNPTRSICGGKPWSRRRCHKRSVFRQAKLAITALVYRDAIMCQGGFCEVTGARPCADASAEVGTGYIVKRSKLIRCNRAWFRAQLRLILAHVHRLGKEAS